MIHISIIIPVFGCSTILMELYLRLAKVLESISSDYEILMINDASPDESWQLIKELSIKDSRVKGIRLSRNFGQHFAINAGLDHCAGDWVVVMDCDLQDIPEEIIKLYQKAQEGYDIAFAKRTHRFDNYFKRIRSIIFHKIFGYLTNIKSDHHIANFGIYRSVVIKEYNRIYETYKIFPVVIRQLGFNTTSINVIHGKRPNGKSSYNLSKLINLALKIIVSQSNKPLYISIYFGFSIALIAFIYGAIMIARYFLYQVPIGYTSIIAAILFTSGLLFCNLGLLGIYLGRVFTEVKSRPNYIIQEKTF